MRYMQQGSLTKQLAGGPLPIPLIARVLFRVSEALDKAHSHGIIHRDIKPSNILLMPKAMPICLILALLNCASRGKDSPQKQLLARQHT